MYRAGIIGGACVAVILTACESAPSTSSITAQALGSFDYECGGGPVTLTGDPADPRSIVIENGIVRLSYPQLASGDQQLGAHMLELRLDGAWQPVLGNWYGDWTFFASPFYESAQTAHVLTETPDVVEVVFEFDHWLDYPGSYSTMGHVPRWWNEETQGACESSSSCRCYLEGCGLPATDFEGDAIFPHNYLDTPKYIRHVTFRKVLRVERCGSGYFVGYHSTPNLTWGTWIQSNPYLNNAGERENGLGWMASVTFASSGVVVRNPEAGEHTSLEIVEQTNGPWWFSSIPDGAPGYALFIAEEHPMPSFVWQFDPAHLGTPLVHKMNPEIELDGRAGRYQTFLGAYPYEMTNRGAEPTLGAAAAVASRLPLQWP
jgi:hypothetical protein